MRTIAAATIAWCSSHRGTIISGSIATYALQFRKYVFCEDKPSCCQIFW
jgi:hypothetical protein